MVHPLRIITGLQFIHGFFEFLKELVHLSRLTCEFVDRIVLFLDLAFSDITHERKVFDGTFQYLL
jgi:hypothetical protein